MVPVGLTLAIQAKQGVENSALPEPVLAEDARVSCCGVFTRTDEYGTWLVEGDVIRREGRVIGRV